MSDDYANVLGGKLLLKGKPLKSSTKKRKKKKKKSEDGGDDTRRSAAHAPSSKELEAVEQPSIYTEAQLRHLRKKQKRDEKEAKEGSKKSYREKIDDFNEYLAALPVHNDVPKVAAAGLG